MSESARTTSVFRPDRAGWENQLIVRFLRVLWNDIRHLRPRLFIANVLVRLFPVTLGFDGVTSEIRPFLYRFAGIRMGARTRIYGRIDLSGAGHVTANLRVGQYCMFTTPLFLNASAPITIGDRVTIGHHTKIITDNHDMSDPLCRCGSSVSRPVNIEDGVWIGAGVTILPGVTLGRGSVVAAGAVVTRNVPANTLVGGVPARPLKALPVERSASDPSARL